MLTTVACSGSRRARIRANADRPDHGVKRHAGGGCVKVSRVDPVPGNLSQSDLADKYDPLVRSGGEDAASTDPGAEGEAEEGSGSTFKLRAWKQRKRPGMGVDPLADAASWKRRPAASELAFPELASRLSETPRRDAAATPKMMPLIDQVHRLMPPWKAGDQIKTDQYLEDRGLRRSELFKQLLQAPIDLSPEGSDERSVLESISNRVQARGMKARETAPLPLVKIVEAESES